MRTKLAFLLGALLSGSLGAQLPDTPLPPPPPGLVAWWTFDEFQSDVCYDRADAFAADLVWDGGRTRGIIQRDGAARHHLSVATGDLDGDGRAESLHCDRKGWDGTIKGSSFTIAMWIAPESLEPLAPPASIVDCRTVTSDGTTNTVRGCAIRFGGSQIGAVFGRGSAGSNVSIVRDLPNLTAGEFVHVAFVCPAPETGGACRIYLNGAELQGDTDVPPWEWPADPTLFVGKSAAGTNGSAFNGRLDDLMIFNRALTADDVTGLAGAGQSGIGPAAPAGFTVDRRRGAIADAFSWEPDPVEPGPGLRARFGGAVQWLRGDEAGGDLVPAQFGHRLRVAAGDVNGDGFITEAVLELRWKPKCPDCDLVITAQLRIDCVRPGEEIGPQSPWDFEHLVTDLPGVPMGDDSFLIKLDLSKLPGGADLLPAIQEASFVDVLLDGEVTDYVQLDVRRQTQSPVAFGLRQEVTSDSILTAYEDRLVLSPRDAASGLATGKRTHSPWRPTKFHDLVYELPSLPPGGQFDYTAARRDWTVDASPPVIQCRATVTGGENGQRDYAIHMETDPDGDSDFVPIVDRVMQVWNTGALVWTGPVDDTTVVRTTGGDKVCTASDGKNIFLTLKAGLVEILGAPGGPLPPLLATDIRVYDRNDLVVRCPDGTCSLEDSREFHLDVEIRASNGLRDVVIYSERAGVTSPRDAATGLSTGRRQHSPFVFLGDYHDGSPDALLRTRTGATVMLDDREGIVGRRALWIEAIESPGTKRILVPPSVERDLPLAFVEPVDAFDLLFESPTVRGGPKSDVYVWKIKTRGLFNGTPGDLDETEMIAIDEPGVHFADASVRLSRVDFSPLGATGYKVVVRGWDPEKREEIMLHEIDSPTLPDIRLDDFPTNCGMVAGPLPGRRWSWPETRGVKVNGQPFDAHAIRVLATGVTGTIGSLHGLTNRFAGFDSLAVFGADVSFIPVCGPCTFDIAGTVDGVMVTFDPTIGWIQDAAGPEGPWLETPGASGGQLIWPRGDRRDHFFRVVGNHVPRQPTP